MTPYQAQSQQVANQVVSSDYYLNQWKSVCKKNDTNTEQIGSLSEAKLCNLWNDFWAALPDSPAIHRTPFYQICDLAEGVDDNE